MSRSTADVVVVKVSQQNLSLAIPQLFDHSGTRWDVVTVALKYKRADTGPNASLGQVQSRRQPFPSDE